MSLIPLYMLISFPNISVIFLFRSGGQYGNDDCNMLPMSDEIQQANSDYDLKHKLYLLTYVFQSLLHSLPSKLVCVCEHEITHNYIALDIEKSMKFYCSLETLLFRRVRKVLDEKYFIIIIFNLSHIDLTASFSASRCCSLVFA